MMNVLQPVRSSVTLSMSVPLMCLRANRWTDSLSG
jgi:hypothetical protein